MFFFFFLFGTTFTDINTLSLLDALPIFLTSNKVWIATDRSRARRCVEACVYGTLDFVGYPRFPAPVEKECRSESGSAGMPRPISYAVFCLKKKKINLVFYIRLPESICGTVIAVLVSGFASKLVLSYR